MSGNGSKGGGGLGSDQRLIMVLVAVMLLLIVGVSVLAPQQAADDPTPSSSNAGPLGTKAAYLTLEGLGHKASRWSRSLTELNDSLSDDQAANTTVILLEPVYDATQEAELKAQLARFLGHGGRVVTTGEPGARLLGGKVKTPELLETLCKTTPKGDSALARAGHVEFSDHGGWQMDDKQFTGDNLQAAQLCDKDAVVVQFTVHGSTHNGTAVWWTAATPFANAELKLDPALKLLVAGIGDGRDVVFIESMHTAQRTLWDAAKGLPIGWIAAQAALLFVLLVLSYSRRRGPVRMPVTLPRSSPVEFATSMGDLYEKGEATGAVTEAARRRLVRVLIHDVGLALQTVNEGPAAVSEALQKRLGADRHTLAKDVAAHLREASEAAHVTISQKSALTLVRALSEDAARVHAATLPVRAKVDVKVAEETAEDIQAKV